jgi:hypothetical protein
MNTEGGVLLIGVDDEGEIIGLGKDHFKTEDKFLLHWVNLVKSYLGAEFIPYMRSMINSVGEQRVLVVECLPSSKPVFFKRDNDESFFVRMTNTTQALKTSESLAYIDEHFQDKQPQAVLEKQQEVQASNGNGSETVNTDTTRRSGHGSHANASLGGWVDELMKRHVIRTAVIYFIVAWALTESGSMVAETLEAPGWVVRFLVLGFVAGFPIAILLSWLYDIRFTKEKPTAPGLSKSRAVKLFLVLVLLSIITIMAYLRFG